MPTLTWTGKEAVVAHGRRVPFQLLRECAELSVGGPGSGNLIVQGDNLLALKALLPYYARRVKCIYIDPPYNTGNEGWVYNDNVNSPHIRDWLGKVVGKEAEDLSRHDKWLCMMYPRLQLLREFLADEGAIFVSLDDNEIHGLRFIMDEIFGERNFVANIIWQKVYSPKNSAKHFSEDHDYIVCYARNAETWRPNLIPRNVAQNKAYKNRDNDPRGPWKTSDLSARNFYSLGTYSITCPSGRIIAGPPTGNYWRVSQEKFQDLDRDHRIWWGKNGDAIPQIKRFLAEVKEGVVPQTLWPYTDVGHTQEAKQELTGMLDFADSAAVFITPKPVRLIERVVQLATDKGSLVLDSFAGSGTTGQAVLSLNKKDGGDRKFILVEVEPTIARTVTAERVKRVAQGYTKGGSNTAAAPAVPTAAKSAKRATAKGQLELDLDASAADAEAVSSSEAEQAPAVPAAGEAVPGLGGGFRYCELGEPLFNEFGAINPKVTFAELARHVFFTETGEPPPADTSFDSPLIGVHKGTAICLLYNGILKDRSRSGGNYLTSEVFESLPPFTGPKVIYGAGCSISRERCSVLGIIFKQTPYDLKTR